jgi:hypothetical protein
MKVLKTAAETASRMALMMGRHLDSTAAWKKDLKTAWKKDLKTSFQMVLKMVPMMDCCLE